MTRRLLAVLALPLLLACPKPKPPQPPTPPTPPPSTGAPYAVERVADTLRAAPGGRGFVRLDGSAVDYRPAYTCCVDSLAFAFGWPGFNRAWVDYLKPLGVTAAHYRLGPFLASDEQNFATVGGAYLEVNGKADLNQWNPKFWAFARDAIGYAVAQGLWVEVDLIDGWGCKEGGYPHHPWSSQYNVQGEDAQTTCGNTVGPRHAAFAAKVVDELGSFGPVTWQDGNEIGIVGWGYKPEWSYALQRIVRERETVNHYPTHMFGTNADRSDAIFSPLVDYVTTHNGAFLAGPIAGKPTMNNEHNPDFGIAGELQAYCQAKAGGAIWGLWPSNLERDAFTQLLQKVQAGCEGVPAGTCPYPQTRPPDVIACHPYTPYGDGTKQDCTAKRDGAPIRPEGDPMRQACEEAAFGGDGSIAFSLANVTGSLTLGPVGNNGSQFVLYGTGSADLVCTVARAGAKNLCAGQRVTR